MSTVGSPVHRVNQEQKLHTAHPHQLSAVSISHSGMPESYESPDISRCALGSACRCPLYMINQTSKDCVFESLGDSGPKPREAAWRHLEPLWQRQVLASCCGVHRLRKRRNRCLGLPGVRLNVPDYYPITVALNIIESASSMIATADVQLQALDYSYVVRSAGNYTRDE